MTNIGLTDSTKAADLPAEEVFQGTLAAIFVAADPTNHLILTATTKSALYAENKAAGLQNTPLPSADQNETNGGGICKSRAKKSPISSLSY
jgi:hypothetical protein